MKNRLKKAVVLGTVGTTAISSVPVSPINLYAEETNAEANMQGSIVTPDTPTITAGASPTVLPTISPTETPSIVTPDVPTSTPTVTPTLVGLNDIRSITELSSDGKVLDNVLYYKKDLTLEFSSSCLSRDVDILSIDILFEDSSKNISFSGASTNSTIAGYSIENLIGATIKYTLTNGQELTQKLSDTMSESLLNLTKIVRDKSAPLVVFSNSTCGIKNGYIVEDGDFIFSVSDSGSGVESIRLKAKSELYGDLNNIKYSFENGILTLNTAQFNSELYSVLITSRDNLGNEATYEYELNLLKEVPKISGLDCPSLLNKNSISYSKNNISLSISGYENSKIKSISLFKDDAYLSEIVNGSFVISENGTYLVVVEDLAGNSKKYTLSELFSNRIQDSVIIDISSPKIELKSKTVSEVNGYINKDGDLVFGISDDESGIDIVSASLDGSNKDLVYKVNTEESTICVNTSQFSNGDYTIVLTASDTVGNTTQYSYPIRVLKYAPDINGVIHSPASVKGNETIVNSNISLEISGHTDDRIRGISVIKDGKYYGSFINGMCSICDSGVYEVVVEDVADNTRIYKLSDLFSDLSSTVVVDSTTPTCSVKVNGTDVEDKWLTESAVMDVVFSDNKELKSATISVNNKIFTYNLEGKEATKTIDLKNDIDIPANGVYAVSIYCEDFAGNMLNMRTFNVKADFTNPDLSGLEVNGATVEANNHIYLYGTLTIKGECTDIGSGIKVVELLDGDKVVSIGLPFNISKSGEYSVRVTDNAGRITSKKLSEIMGTSTNSLICDNEPPTIKKLDGFKPDLTLGKVDWYSSCPVFSFSITDENIRNVSIKVNGDEKVTKVSDEGKYEVDTKGYEGEVSVEVFARDYFGHTNSLTYKYSVDKDCPIISISELSEPHVSRKGTLFFKKSPTLKVVAEDKGIGLDRYILVNKNKDKVSSNNTGVFELGSGEYTLEVKDLLGNTTNEIALKDLLGLNSNIIVVDSKSPAISAKRPNGCVDGWYSKDIKYPINLSDNQGIKSATVKINGKVVKTYTSDDITTKTATIYADTSKTKADEKGMYQISVEVIDNAGNSKSWSDAIYIDSKEPVVEKFVFTGDGVQEGANIGGSDKYGFFFKGDATCEIYVSDGDISSGIDKLYVTIEEIKGDKLSSSIKKVKVVNGVAKINLASNFKGFISAYAVDKVGNQGKVAKPDGVILEDSNCFMNSVSIDINLPKTEYKDEKGIELYSGDLVASSVIGSTYSGIRSVAWGVGGKTLGTVNVDSRGKVSGSSVNVIEKNKNLVVNLSNALNIQGNENGMEVWVSVVDRTGRTSKSSKKLSIDKDIPKIEVAWNNTTENGYYKEGRTATVTVHERNFDASLFTVSGNYGTLGGWSNNGDTWTNTISFNEDGEYNFTLDCTDRAGNKATSYSSEKFTVDKTAPLVSVAWDNSKPKNENYYNTKRTATITVVDKNFDGSKIHLEGNGSLGGWSTSGDTHTSTVSFSEDGEYKFSLSGEDLAGNAIEPYTSGKFIIDTSIPTVKISGVQEGVSYKEDVSIRVDLSDNYLDKTNTTVTLKGKRNGLVELKGSVNGNTGSFTLDNLPKEENYDDVYTLSVVGVDMAGNLVEESVVFSVNRFGSSYSFEDPSILNTYLSSPKDIVIVESNVDKLDMDKAKVSVILDGVEVFVDKSNISIKETEQDGKYTYTYSISKNAFSKDGKYLVQVYSSSFDGTNYNSVSEEYYFVLDTVAPKIIVSGVESDKNYHDYSKKVTIDIRDVTGAENISVKLNGKEISPTKENGIYSFTISESSTPQTLEVNVVDLAGNSSSVTVDKFVVTSSIWVYLMNQMWFKLSIGAVVSLLGLVVALIFARRRKARKTEQDILKQQADLYRTTSTGSSGLNLSEGKDLVEDLEGSKTEK